MKLHALRVSAASRRNKRIAQNTEETNGKEWIAKREEELACKESQ